MVDGVQCVMMDGMNMMPILCVDNWDLNQQYYINLDKGEELVYY